MELMTIKDIMSTTGKAERTVRDMVKREEVEWSGETRGREKLYWWGKAPAAPAPEKVVREKPPEAKPGETYNLLRVLADSGEITPEQASRLANMVDDLRRARAMDKKALEKEAADLDVRARQLDEIDRQLAASMREFQEAQKQKAESWENDQEMLTEEREELESERAELASVARRIDLVKKWIGTSVNTLLTSPTWKDAYWSEKTELPEWPMEVKEQEVVEWMDLDVDVPRGGEEKAETKGKKATKKSG